MFMNLDNFVFETLNKFYLIYIHMSAISAFWKDMFIYRALRYQGGFGIHSPFVYNLITKVIEIPCEYYRYYDIELIRKELLFRDTPLAYPDRKKVMQVKKSPLGFVVKREAIGPKDGALLFRLTNYLKPKNILQIGTNMGISTLYLTTYAPNLNCISLENIPQFASVIQISFEKGARCPIDLRVGNYRITLPEALVKMPHPDFVFFNTRYEQTDNEWIFETCLKQITDKTIFVFCGIRANTSMRSLWRRVCDCTEVSVSMDLHTMGIAFFDKKLHKKNYIVYF